MCYIRLINGPDGAAHHSPQSLVTGVQAALKPAMFFCVCMYVYRVLDADHRPTGYLLGPLSIDPSIPDVFKKPSHSRHSW